MNLNMCKEDVNMGNRSVRHVKGNRVGVQLHDLHVQGTLSLGCFLRGAVANQSAALGQTQVKGQQRAVLHADSPQSGAVDLQAKQV